MVKITVDTSQDSKEDILNAIDLLQKYVSVEGAYVREKTLKEKESNNNFNTDISGMAGFASMLGGSSEPSGSSISSSSSEPVEKESEKKADDEAKIIIEY